VLPIAGTPVEAPYKLELGHLLRDRDPLEGNGVSIYLLLHCVPFAQYAATAHFLSCHSNRLGTTAHSVEFGWVLQHFPLNVFTVDFQVL
jgi:hypothetical protein